MPQDGMERPVDRRGNPDRLCVCIPVLTLTKMNPEPYPLRLHQHQAVARITAAFNAGAKAFLDASEVGTGKTRSACVACKRDGWRVLVVAPLSTESGWFQEAATVGFQLQKMETIRFNKGRRFVFPPTGNLWINYDQAIRFRDQIILDGKFDCVVFDESHKLKGRGTKRHKLWEALRCQGVRSLFLTATPGQDPLDMRYLADVAGFNPFRFWQWVRGFRGIFQPPFAHGGYKYRPGFREDAEKLRALLSGPLALRRTPQDIAGWPELQRIMFPVPFTDREKIAYQRAFEDYLGQRATPLPTVAEKLVAVGQFRMASSKLRVPYTVDLARTLIEQGRVVTIHCEYIEPAREILMALAKVCVPGYIDGQTSANDRRVILEKSAADGFDALIFTVMEGINLHQLEDSHRQRVQIDHDVRWSGLMQHQVDGRTHRAGRNALVYWVYAPGTVEDRVLRVLRSRLETMNTLNSGISADELVSIAFEKEPQI